MKKIKIICDAIADMPKDLINQYDIHEVPVSINIDGNEFKSNEIEKHEFYKMIKEAKDTPKTSQATYIDFKKVFEKYLNQGYEVLYISGSSRISGTYQSAMLAKTDIEGDLTIFDSMNISFGCGILVLTAARMAQEGKSIAEILLNLEHLKDNLLVILSVGSLDYLKKGGRISAGKAFIGNVLNIKPILAVEDGIIVQKNQVRGNKRLISEFINRIKEGCSSGFINKTVAIAYGDSPDTANQLLSAIKKEFSPKEIILLETNPLVCSHTGPDFIGFACFK